MSMSAVQEFLTKVSEDQALQEQVAEAMQSENDRESVTALANSHGFEFTAEELSQEIANREAAIQNQIASDELNEEELEAIAGGKGGKGAIIQLSVEVTIRTTPQFQKIKW